MLLVGFASYFSMVLLVEMSLTMEREIFVLAAPDLTIAEGVSRLVLNGENTMDFCRVSHIWLQINVNE